MLQTILDAVPALLVAAVIVLIGYVVAKAVRSLVESFLSGIGADELPGRLGLTFLEARAGQTPPSKLIGAVTAVVILLITAQQACAKLRFDQLADLLQRIVAYLPNLAVGLIILLAAMSLGLRITELYSRWKNSGVQNWALVRNQLAVNIKLQNRIVKHENLG